jgi:hypothetical protein
LKRADVKPIIAMSNGGDKVATCAARTLDLQPALVKRSSAIRANRSSVHGFATVAEVAPV